MSCSTSAIFGLDISGYPNLGKIKFSWTSSKARILIGSCKSYIEITLSTMEIRRNCRNYAFEVEKSRWKCSSIQNCNTSQFYDTRSVKLHQTPKINTSFYVGGDGKIFRSSERQQIIDYILKSKLNERGAELDEKSPLGKHIFQQFPLHMKRNLTSLRQRWVHFWKTEDGVSAQPWSPLSLSPSFTIIKLRQSFQSFFNNLLSQPLDDIAEYFGTIHVII